MTREEQIESYLPLCARIAMARYRKLGVFVQRLLVVEFEDLYHVAVMGMLEALDTFDGRGSERSYIASRIVYAVIDHLRSYSWFDFRTREVRIRESEAALNTMATATDPTTELLNKVTLDGLSLRLSRQGRFVIAGLRRGLSGGHLARKLGVHETRVAQIKRQALDAMRARAAA